MNTMMYDSFPASSRPVVRDLGKIIYTTPADLVRAYLETHLKKKSSYRRQSYAARPWLLTLTAMPTRAQILERQQARGETPSVANTEVQLLRAAIRWGLYHDCWQGEDPTVGIRKFKTKKRKRVAKQEEVKQLLAYFEAAQSVEEIRNRALFGLMLFTGCRPGEARNAKLHSITPYGAMGSWNKGTTKNGEQYEVPVPAQYMPWLAAWKTIRPARPNPYLFPGPGFERRLTEHMLVHLWRDLRLVVGLHGLWNYDLRRSLATHLSNELNYSDAKIDAILGHEKTSSLGHYLHVSFDAMCEPIQHYADWLCALRDEPRGERQESAPLSDRPTDEEDRQRLQSLSGREYETLVRLGRGQSCTDIAGHLRLSVQAVNSYRSGLLRKLHLSSAAGLIRYAIEHQAELPLPAPVQSPVIAPVVVSQPIPARTPIVYSAHSYEREEWPG